jgi:hypothetical protein
MGMEQLTYQCRVQSAEWGMEALRGRNESRWPGACKCRKSAHYGGRGAVDEDAAHGFGSGSEEVGASLEPGVGIAREANPGFVDEGGARGSETVETVGEAGGNYEL